MQVLRRLATAGIFLSAACGSIDRSALDPNAVDDAATTSDTGGTIPGSDAGGTRTDAAGRTDVATLVDVGTIDVPRPDDVVIVMPVDAGPPPVDNGPPPPRDVPAADPCASSAACGVCTARNNCGWCDDVGACLTGTGSGPNNRACASANWSWTQRDCPTTPPPPVDAGSPVDSGTSTCRACTAFAPVAFCSGPGPGTCLAYDGCGTDGCSTCAAPMLGPDNCATPQTPISGSGRRRAVFTTCGLADDIDTNCGTPGPDMVLAFTVARGGQVDLVLTAPPGVGISLGFDIGPTSCANARTGRFCNGNTSSSTQSVNTMLPAGTYYVYVATSQPATVVVDATLP